MRTPVVAVLPVLAACLFVHARDAVIVGADSAATVVIAAKPDESSRLAAAEFTNHVFLVTGRLLPVVEGRPPASGAKVFIGTLDAYPVEVPAAAKAYIASAKKGEAAWTGTVDGNLHVVGRREVADLYATYHFLESKLGIIWFKAPIPGDPGMYVTKAKTIVLKPFAEGREPSFEIRRLDMCCAIWFPPPYGKVTAVRNGFQTFSSQLIRHLDKPDSENYKFYRPRQWRGDIGMGGGHETFYGPVSEAKYFKDHPEYFALVGGKRVPGKQICMSNPEVQRIVADYIIANYHKNGDVGSYLFGLVDVAHGWCECDACRALDADVEVKEASRGTPNISTRFNKTAAAIMEMVRKEVPDADLRVWAYSTYRTLPIGFRHDPRVKVQFCDHGRCYGHAFDDPSCPRNRDLYNLMLGWLKVTPQVYTYEYFTCSAPRYICHERVEEHDIKLYHRLGMVGWKNEAEFTGSNWANKRWVGAEMNFQTNWQWLWMVGKLLWDVSLDGMKLIDGAEEKYYGVAYPAMKKYHALRRKIWDASPVCMGYPAGDARRPTLLNLPGAKEELLALLDEADRLSASADAVTKFRVAQDRKWLNEYWIKPNDELAEKISKAYRVNETAKPPVIDGDADDACWAGAQYVSDFGRPWGKDAKKPIPKELETLVGLLYDDENIYVLVKAKEPHMDGVVMLRDPAPDAPVWSGEDSIEVFLAPPSVDGGYYQVASNLKGAIFDAAHPGARASWNSGAVVKSKNTADGWTMEMKIPVNRIHPLKRGDIWKLMVARNRAQKDNLNPSGTGFTLGCGEYHNTGNYMPIEIGAAYLVNGSFEDVDKDGQPKAWSKISKTSKVVDRSGSKALEMDNCTVFQLITRGELNQRPYPRRMSVKYRAKGPGVIKVFALRYSDKHDPRTGKNNRTFLPSAEIAKVELGDGERLMEHEYEIAADEWIGLGFRVDTGPVVLDDVFVNLVGK